MPSGTVIINNGPTRVEVDTDHGRILQIANADRQLELIGEPSLGENFRMLAPLPGLRGHYLLGRDQDVASIDQTSPTTLTTTWTRLRSNQGTFPITVTQEIAVDDLGDVRFRMHVHNECSHHIEEVHNVTLGGLRAPTGPREDWRIHYANHVGQGHEWPVFDQFPGSYLGPEKPVWIGAYHGGLSMPWIDIYDQSARHGFYFGNHDPNARQSYIFAELTPCTTYRGTGSNAQYWPDPEHSGNIPVGLALGWANIPFIAPGDSWEGPEIVLHFHNGTWWEAAQYFRDWHDQEAPTAIQRSWLSDEDAWQSTIISYPDDTIGYRFSDIPKLAEAAAAVGIHVLQLDGWDIGGIDREYPRYEPDPRLGTWRDLELAIRQCHALGVKVLLFSNLQWINIETDWFHDQLGQYAARDPYGNIRGGMGWHYRTILGLTNQCIHRMVPANCARPEFQKIILSQLQHIVDLGADGTQLDKLGATYEIDYSPDNPLPRDRSGPEGIQTTLRQFAAQARSAAPGFAIASEVHWDKIVDVVDASYSRFFSVDHQPTFAAAFPEYRQSCCITGQWDYGLVNNCIRYGHIINLEGDCLHSDARAMPDVARYVAEVLQLRRSLRHRIWDSRLIDPSQLAISSPPEVRLSLHESLIDGVQTAVMNHFTPQDQTVTVNPANAVSKAMVYRPAQAPEPVALPADVTVHRDEVVIVEMLA